jgi:hypothetical protein
MATTPARDTHSDHAMWRVGALIARSNTKKCSYATKGGRIALEHLYPMTETQRPDQLENTMTTKPLLPEMKPSGNTHGIPLERRRGFLAGMGGEGLPVTG